MEHLSSFLGPPLPWDTHPSHSKPLDGVPLHSCGLDVLPIRGQQHVSTCSVSSLAASPIGTPAAVVPVVEAQTSHSSSSTIFSQPKAGLASVSHWHTPRNLPSGGWRNMRDTSLFDDDSSLPGCDTSLSFSNCTSSWDSLSDDTHLDADVSSTGSSKRDDSSHPDAALSPWDSKGESSNNCSRGNACSSLRDLSWDQSRNTWHLDAEAASSGSNASSPMGSSPTRRDSTGDASDISFHAIFCSSPNRSGHYLPNLEESAIDSSSPMLSKPPHSSNLTMGTTSCATFTEVEEGLDQTLASDPAEAGLTLQQNVGRRMIDVILHEDYEYRRSCSSVGGRHDQKWVCRYASRFKCKGTLRIIVQDLEDFMNGASIRHKREHNHDPFSFDADDSDKYNLENYSTDDLSTIFERMVATKRIVGNKSRRL